MSKDKFTLFLPPPQSDEPGTDAITMLSLEKTLDSLLNLKVLKFSEHDLRKGLPILKNEDTEKEYCGPQEIKEFLDKSGFDSTGITIINI